MPITAAVWVTVCVLLAAARAMPKSITLTSPAGVSMTLAGLMSRWTIPAACATDSAAQTSATISRARCGSSRPSDCTTSRSVRPRTCSMTIQGTPPVPSTASSPVSYTETMHGAFSDAADCASRRKRCWNDGSRARSARRTLTATSRPSRVSVPRKTSAMPPTPIVPARA